VLGPSVVPEPFGRVFAEAAALGVPSVACRTGGLPEAVGDGALLLEPGAGAEAWRRALDSLEEPGRYETLRAAALEHARELADANRQRSLVDLVCAAAAGGPRPGPEPPAAGRKLRVAYVIGALPRGGAELSLYHLASRLDRDRFQPQVVCTRAEDAMAGDFRSSGVPVTLVRLPSRYSPVGLWRLARFLAREGMDVVHTQMRRANTSGRVAAWLAGVPVVLAHIRNLPVDKSWRHFAVDRILSWATARVVAVSPQVAHAEHVRSGVPLDKFSVQTNARDLERFSPGSRDAARDGLGVPRDDLVIGFAGRLHPNKRPRVMLRAFARALEQVPELRLLLAGDGPLRGELGRLAGELGVSDRVTFLGWQEDMVPVYRAMDFLCQISYIEGYGCSLLEALACGVPAVATPVGFMAELLGDGRSGILVPVDEVGPAAEAMVRLARDPALRAEMSAAARRAAEPHGIDEYVRRLERLYLDLWARRRGG
jgi:glycosyltransferase involved in cell wall biosynthesis